MLRLVLLCQCVLSDPLLALGTRCPDWLVGNPCAAVGSWACGVVPGVEGGRERGEMMLLDDEDLPPFCCVGSVAGPKKGRGAQTGQHSVLLLLAALAML